MHNCFFILVNNIPIHIHSSSVLIDSLKSNDGSSAIHQGPSFRKKLDVNGRRFLYQAVPVSFHSIDNSNIFSKKILGTEIFHPVGISANLIGSGRKIQGNKKGSVAYSFLQ